MDWVVTEDWRLKPDDVVKLGLLDRPSAPSSLLSSANFNSSPLNTLCSKSIPLAVAGKFFCTIRLELDSLTFSETGSILSIEGGFFNNAKIPIGPALLCAARG